jgi:hypothetical protein
MRDCPFHATIETEEFAMSRYTSIAAVAALSVGILFTGTEMASAQKSKKMSYDEAYAKCQGEVKALYPNEAGPGARYSRGAACMKKHGYRLKKGATM